MLDKTKIHSKTVRANPQKLDVNMKRTRAAKGAFFTDKPDIFGT